MDPPESTIAKVWIWHDGGADFGVPLSNYLGWLLTSWLFYSAFAFYLRQRLAMGREGAQAAQQNRKLPSIAILFYVSAGLTHVTGRAALTARRPARTAHRLRPSEQDDLSSNRHPASQVFDLSRVRTQNRHPLLLDRL